MRASFNKGLQMYRYFQFSKQTSQKHWYLQCFDKTTCKIHDVLKQFFTIFQLMRLHSKNDHLSRYFVPPLIRAQEGVRSGKIAELHLNLIVFEACYRPAADAAPKKAAGRSAATMFILVLPQHILANQEPRSYPRNYRPYCFP